MSLVQEAENRVIFFAERGDESSFVSAILDLSAAKGVHISRVDVEEIIKARYEGEDVDDMHRVISAANRFYSNAGLGVLSDGEKIV